MGEVFRRWLQMETNMLLKVGFMKKNFALFLLFALNTTTWAELPNSIRCEGVAPYRRYNDGEIKGKVLSRMYDLKFNYSTMTYSAEYKLIVQTQCCGVPVKENFNVEVPDVGSFLVAGENQLQSANDNDVNAPVFDINLAQNTCTFTFPRHSRLKGNYKVQVNAKLVSVNGKYISF
jgi:hypothetical protein